MPSLLPNNKEQPYMIFIETLIKKRWKRSCKSQTKLNKS